MSAENIKKVDEYITKAGTFFVTTVDGDKPKCRPFGFHMLVDDKIYFGMGTFKDVFKQIEKNPYVEICALQDHEFLRYYGTAEIVMDKALSDKALAMMPQVKAMYEENGFTMAMIYLKDATAEFRTMMDIKESFKF